MVFAKWACMSTALGNNDPPVRLNLTTRGARRATAMPLWRHSLRDVADNRRADGDRQAAANDQIKPGHSCATSPRVTGAVLTNAT